MTEVSRKSSSLVAESSSIFICLMNRGTDDQDTTLKVLGLSCLVRAHLPTPAGVDAEI